MKPKYAFSHLALTREQAKGARVLARRNGISISALHRLLLRRELIAQGLLSSSSVDLLPRPAISAEPSLDIK